MKCEHLPISQTEIVKRVKEGGISLKNIMDPLISALCQCRVFTQTVVRYVLDNRGNLQDAEDILQEGLARLVVNLYENKYNGDASIENYAFGICKFLWNNRRRKNSRIDYYESNTHPTFRQIEAGIDAKHKKEDEKMIWTIIASMNENCKRLLYLVYCGLSYREIGEEMEFAEQTVKNKVSGCRKKLRSYIQEQPHLKIYFRNQ